MLRWKNKDKDNEFLISILLLLYRDLSSSFIFNRKKNNNVMKMHKLKHLHRPTHIIQYIKKENEIEVKVENAGWLA